MQQVTLEWYKHHNMSKKKPVELVEEEITWLDPEAEIVLPEPKEKGK
jgi:hypothetical protein